MSRSRRGGTALAKVREKNMKYVGYDVTLQHYTKGAVWVYFKEDDDDAITRRLQFPRSLTRFSLAPHPEFSDPLIDPDKKFRSSTEGFALRTDTELDQLLALREPTQLRIYITVWIAKDRRLPIPGDTP